jgi:hypothetical protein
VGDMGLHDWQLEFQLNYTTLNCGTSSRLFTGKPLEKLLVAGTVFVYTETSSPCFGDYLSIHFSFSSQ